MSISNNKKKERINYSRKRHTTLYIPPRKPSLPFPRKKIQKQSHDLTLSPKNHQKQKKKKSKKISYIFLFSSHALPRDMHKKQELERKNSTFIQLFKYYLLSIKKKSNNLISLFSTTLITTHKKKNTLNLHKATYKPFPSLSIIIFHYQSTFFLNHKPFLLLVTTTTPYLSSLPPLSTLSPSLPNKPIVKVILYTKTVNITSFFLPLHFYPKTDSLYLS